MKKLLALILILAMVPVIALADLPDISGLTFDELIELREKINYTLFFSDEYQEVNVPIGVWTIGEDIPEGTWTISVEEDVFGNIWYGDVLNESGTGAGYGWDWANGVSETLSGRKNKDGTWKYPDDPSYISITFKNGWYFVNSIPVVISTYLGKPDLGFK